MIEKITNRGRLLSIIIRSQFQDEGIRFFTPDDYSQQLAYMNRPKGYIIAAHIHNIVPRKVELTNEVLIIKSGKVRIDYYDNEECYLESKVLETGDIALLVFGGHGFEMLEDSEIIEVKQGPYAGQMDKTIIETADKELAATL